MSHSVVDAIWLDFAGDARLFQAQGFQARDDQGFFLIGVDGQLRIVQPAVVILVKEAQYLRVIFVSFQTGHLQIPLGHRSFRVAVDPVPGSDQVVRRQSVAAISFLARQQGWLVAADQDAAERIAFLFDAATGRQGRAVWFHHRPVQILAGRRLHLWNVATLTID